MPHDARVAPLEGLHLLLGTTDSVGGVAQLVALHSVPREAQAVEGGALVGARGVDVRVLVPGHLALRRVAEALLLLEPGCAGHGEGEVSVLSALSVQVY